MSEKRLSREEGRLKVADLVRRYRSVGADAERNDSTYTETDARTGFITPLLEALGWDVRNVRGRPLDLREVVEEPSLSVEEEGTAGGRTTAKKPDYELRAGRRRVFFVEAKRPSVRIFESAKAAFQTRRYGYSAKLPVSVLTNFAELAIYDCAAPPDEDHDASFARRKRYGFEDYLGRFDELWDDLSRESVYGGRFEERFAEPVVPGEPFDAHFLQRVRSWRKLLAEDAWRRNPNLSPVSLTYVVQLFLCRLVFLRACEDRAIEKYESLLSVARGGETYVKLMEVIRRADRFYDSGLFCLLDDERLGVTLGDDALATVIEELYYPHSRYDFAVVDAGVLGEIYDQFLGEQVVFDSDGNADTEHKPEVRESGGVFPTPQWIVDAILDRALEPRLATVDEHAVDDDLGDFTVADLCCGSGVFLLAAYDRLVAYRLQRLVDGNDEVHLRDHAYEVAGGWRLGFKEKRRLLLECVRGVDVDAAAVEVARFSLLLKLLEGETEEGLKAYVRQTKQPALPSLRQSIRWGNSLVTRGELQAGYTGDDGKPAVVPEEVETRITPFDFGESFPNDFARGGFDVIVGNPPYVRIQHMVTYAPEEVKLFQAEASVFTTGRVGNFDKYNLFVERSLELLAPGGRLGLIVPWKFMVTRAGSALRTLLTATPLVEEIVHFGAQQVFGGDARNYTCLLTLRRGVEAPARVERVTDLALWRRGEPGDLATVTLDASPWQFASAEASAVFDRVEARWPVTLAEAAAVFVGVQTSADDVYIVTAVREDDHVIYVEVDGLEWPLERGLLRPCLMDVQLNAFGTPEPNRWMIFPYRIGPKQNGRGDEARLVQPDEMRATYPGVFSYLMHHRQQLDERSVAGGRASERQFYQFGRSQSLVKFNTPKLITPALSLEPRWAYDASNTMVTGGGNGPYYLIRERPGGLNLDFLHAIVCHPFFEAAVRRRASVFRGGYYSHGKQYIEPVPVPQPHHEEVAAVATAVRELRSAVVEARMAGNPRTAEQKRRRASRLQEGIENQVTTIYGLSEVELAIVQDVEAMA